MSVENKGKDLFIVDNSVSGWTGLRYLEEWTAIAKSFDIATGYFEIGALLALDGINPAYSSIALADADEGRLQVLAEFVEVLRGES
jgi:hypothetical protein